MWSFNNADMEHTGEGYMYSTREKAGIWVVAILKGLKKMSENSEAWAVLIRWAYCIGWNKLCHENG